jgi:predicted nuclease of predicted toxin-antitoxin system
MAKCSIPFFIDNCVAESVPKLLEKAGHNVVRLRDCMPRDTKDPVVAIAASASGRVLVTRDKDFKQIAKSLNTTRRDSQQLHRVALRCPDPNSAKRMQAALPLIEFEWARHLESMTMQPFLIEITDTAIRVVR